MTRKPQQAKRKVEEEPVAETSKNVSDPEEEDDEGFFNVINSDNEDSSDSDGEVEDSEEETEVAEDVSDEDAKKASSESEEENNGSEDDEVEDEQEEEDEEDSNSSESDTENEVELPTDKEITKLEPNKSKIIVPKESTSNEYADDSSDEEDIRNTVGNIPMQWYQDFKHLGYDWDGLPIGKPAIGDSIDEFLKRVEDPDFWRTVKDPQTGQDVVLSEEDISLIRRIQAQKIPDVSFDAYAPWIEWFTSQVEEMPLRKFPEHKRSFLPSKDEARKVSKLVHSLKMGWIKTESELAKLRAKKDPQFYMLWTTDDQPEEYLRGIHRHIAAPKRHLPGHAESYNPPSEYLFDAKELKQWEKQKNSPWQRKLHFIPQKYATLRNVPSYGRFIKERFLRCLDLYLCPRAIKMRVTVEPDALVPKLPSPRDLQPFPTTLSIEYIGHDDMVRTISVDRTGQYLASGSDDGTVRIWEVNTGRCFKKFDTGDVVRSVQWCPNAAISLLLVASGQRVILLNPHVGDLLVNTKTDEVLATPPAATTAEDDTITSERIKAIITWSTVVPDTDEYNIGFRIILTHFRQVTQVTWHGRGDYFATVMPDGQNRSVLISQLSRRRSQLPFAKSKGQVQCVLFHPIRPVLFVATQRHVRVYDLVQQALVKKLMTNSRWISRMAVHPAGDNLLVATYDRKVLWFDLDLSSKPYKTLRLHGTAVRGIAFHKRYPLFASGSDCRSLIVSHGMVYNDLLQNPLIVPLKRLQDHKAKNDFGIFDVEFHPLQPWVFSSGADGTIKLYSN